ncbi:MAG: hypothetical protein GY849_17545, partial [Deltaproteobacteria bacterium]|nr:hypothetical protein [Deltaproteobacteria bacterium]
EVVRGRIEKEGNHLIPERQAIITARALAPLPRTLAWCAPYAASQGMILSFQGTGFKKALYESSQVMKEHRLFLKKTIPYTLPGKDFQRHLLIFIKGV